MHYTHLMLVVSLAALSACTSAPTSLPPNALEEMQPLPRGELIYKGDVFVESTTQPMFRYERHVEHQPTSLWTSTHITRHTNTGALAVVQRATHSSRYALRHFKEVHAQTGVVSSVDVLEDGSLEFQDTRGTHTELTVENTNTTTDVVVGPTLIGYILTHWDKLVEGETLNIRFASTERAASYIFTLRRTDTIRGEVAIAMLASNFLIRLATTPIQISFTLENRQFVRYEGVIPPKGTDLKTLNAHVEYAYVSDVYY